MYEWREELQGLSEGRGLTANKTMAVTTEMLEPVRDGEVDASRRDTLVRLGEIEDLRTVVIMIRVHRPECRSHIEHDIIL
jgi:hypothetical protein